MLLLSTGLIKSKLKKAVKFNKLENNPFARSSVLKTAVVTPRKPNSARRPIIKTALINKNVLLAHIPGIGHNLRKHSLVLIRGGGARDLPMVSYSCIRGVFDLIGVINRVSRRSIYGIKKIKISYKKNKFKRF